LLVEATRMFADRGYAEVSIDDVGARLGLTGAAIYHHFPTKLAMLMVGGEMRAAQPLRARVTEDELRQRPRLSGISRLEQVGCVVLEGNGQISVPRRDADLDPWLLDDVPGAAGIGK